MNIKEQLIREIEQAPLPLVSKILDFVRYLKTRQPNLDFMDFAGMAVEIDQIMQEIVSEAEESRQVEADRLIDP